MSQALCVVEVAEELRIARSSGSAALDQETLDLVHRTQPFPAPPAAMPGAQIDLTVPIRFNIH